jgi:outer membrane protein insertion porin family
MLYIDGMFNGRGWMGYAYNIRGKAMWNNIIELRVPLFPGLLSFDFFFDTSVVKEEPSQLFNDIGIEDFYFSFGPGLRFSMPQFPLRLLFGCAFKNVDGKVVWLTSGSELISSKPQLIFILSFNLTNR